MALDDFATAAEMGLDPNEIDLDEDLFDFPLQLPQDAPSEEELRARVSTAKAESGTAPSPEPPPVAESPTQSPSETMEIDPELDEDLFSFPSNSSSDTRTSAPEETTLENQLDQATQGVSDLLEDDDLDELIGTEEAVPEGRTSSTQPEGAVVASPQAAPTGNPQGTIPLNVPVDDVIRPLAVSEGNPRMAWTLTATVILFVVGVLVISWRATTNLDRSMAGMKESLEESNHRAEAQNALTMQRLSEMEAELLRRQKLATQAAAGVPTVETPREMMAPHELSLDIAEEALGEGQYEEARRVLYHLLATADQIPAKERDAAEESAAFLIAKTYRAEAKALEGDQR